MSAVDAPPGIAFAGQASGVFVAKPRARRLAARVFFFAGAAGVITLGLAGRRLHAPLVELLFIAPLMCMSVATVGFAVRSAHIRVDGDGVRWGWRWGGFRLSRARLVRIDGYEDAFALVPRRGSTWYLSRRDWLHFDRIAQAMQRARLPLEIQGRAAPIGARLQSYGVVLDGLLILDAIAAGLSLSAAFLA